MANFFENVSIRNKVLLALFISFFLILGIGIVFFNKTIEIKNSFVSDKIFKEYKDNFQKLQNLYYNLEVCVVKSATAPSQEIFLQEQNRYKNLNLQIESVFKSLQEIDIKEINSENDTLLLSLADSISSYQKFYNDNIKLSIDKMQEYVFLIFHPEKIRENYEQLLAEQQSLGAFLDYEKNYTTKDEIVWELTTTYQKSVISSEVYIVSSIEAQQSRLTNLIAVLDMRGSKQDEILSDVKKEGFIIAAVIFVLAILLVIGMTYFINISIVKPLFRTIDILDNLSKGKIPEKEILDRTDEIGIILESLNELISHLDSTAKFSMQIAEGNFKFEYIPAGEDDILGNSLINLRESLIKAKKEEERRELEDMRRRKTADGIAKFSDILRQNQNNLKKLGRVVISELVKFLNANQGVIFIVKEDNEHKYLDLLSAYAWNREKFIEKRIEFGDGLIGSVAVEKFTVYMTDVPEDYIEIKSGTGSANPRSILIVPLKIDEEVLGVLEIASFHEFEEFEIKFVETLAENIASTLNSVKISAQTSELLEKFQIQAAEMKEQEIAMKSTIEELKKAHEENKKKEEELKNQIKAVQELNKQIQYKDEQLKKEIERLTEENERKLRIIEREQRQSRYILQAMQIGVLIIKKGGEIDFVNNSLSEMLGYEELELVGSDIDKIFENPPDLGDKKICEYLFENKEKFEREGGKMLFLKLKDGRRKKFEIQVMVMEEEDSDDMKMVVFIRELVREGKQEKDMKKTLQELVKANFELYMKVEFLEEYLRENNVEVPEFKVNKNEMIKWGPKFFLGISIIDNQHKRWIEFINKLYKSIMNNRAKEEMEGIFKELMDYTEYHFGFEEKYMKEFGYENFDAHNLEHEKFVNSLVEMFVEFIDGRVASAYKLIYFLKSWVSDHVLITDRKYVELFKKHGIK